MRFREAGGGHPPPWYKFVVFPHVQIKFNHIICNENLALVQMMVCKESIGMDQDKVLTWVQKLLSFQVST